MATKVLLERISRVRGSPAPTTKLASLSFHLGQAPGAGQAPLRHFMRDFLPTLVYCNGADGLAVTRTVSAEGQTSPRVVATFVGGATKTIDARTNRDTDIFDALMGSGAAAALGPARVRVAPPRPMRTKAAAKLSVATVDKGQ